MSAGALDVNNRRITPSSSADLMRLCVRAAGLGDVDDGEDLGRLADVDTGGGVSVPGKGKRVNNRKWKP